MLSTQSAFHYEILRLSFFLFFQISQHDRLEKKALFLNGRYIKESTQLAAKKEKKKILASRSVLYS